MKLTQITYRRLFNTGSYTNESIELSGTLEPNEDVMQAYTELHKMAEELHYSKNAEMYAQQGTHVRDIVEDKPRSLVEDIRSCKEVTVLESYKFIIRGKPELQEAYNETLKILTNE